MSAPDSGGFELAISSLDQGATVVTVRGDVDMATSSELEAALEPATVGGRIVIDLTECAFLDSSGIKVVLVNAERASSAGGGLLLVASDPRILRVLEIAGVENRIPIHPTLEAARAAATS